MLSQRLRLLLLLAFAICSAACGGCKGSDDDLCEDVTCESGTCNPDTGECESSASCSEEEPCEAGFDCVDGSCVAAQSCSEDEPCERGECVDGACVNPDSCDDDTDCVGGFACDGDVCVEDACDLVECERGVCDVATGECVDAAVCTAETQDTDCLEGSVCYSGACTPEEDVCAEIACTRGVCDVDALDCANAESCQGDDQNCLEGYFCDDTDTCVQNVCDANMVDCPRGVCNASTGTCVNAENCAALEECRDGFYCILGDCVDADDACDTCPGNMECSYDADGLDVACEESPDGCNTSIDCVGDRVCSNGTCADPEPCEADEHEPNESAAEATDWFTTAADGGVEGSVCSGDQDWFAFDTAEHPRFTGTLVAEVVFAAEDIGNGGINIEILDEAGTSVASNVSAAGAQRVRAEYSIGNINQGTYSIVVSDSGDIGLAGIDYQLFVDLVDDAAAELCTNAREITASTMGDTSNSSSNSLGSSCAIDSAGSEEAYWFDVEQRSFVTIEVTGPPELDAVLSLRRQCEADASEIACANDGGPRESESLARRLEPGRYFVAVQGASGTEQGAYTLDVTQEPVVCTSADNTCIDASTASACNAQGTGFDTVACETGCDMDIGNCMRDAGDVCTTATVATGGFTGSLPLGALTNDYDPGSTCVSDSDGSVTDGPDGVFQVTLQTNELLIATVTSPGFNVYHGMYLVDDCADVTASCLIGVNQSPFASEETLVWENTGAPGDFFLIVDSEAGTTGSVDVEIVTGTVICTPGEMMCNGSTLETCNEFGTAWDQRVCNHGCDATALACNPAPNDTCAGAIDVSAGGMFSGLIEDYSNDYSARSCTGFTAAGGDGAYVIHGNAGDIVTVTASASFDISIAAVTDCSDTQFSCIVGADEEFSNGTEEIEFKLPSSDPVYLIVDTFSTSATGNYDIDVSITSPDCTNYESAIACLPDGTTLEVCDELGRTEQFTCDTTCSGTTCDDPSGDRCFDAITLFDGSTYSGTFSDFEADYDPGVGTCLLQPADRQLGPEAVFAIDLSAGDLLSATVDSTSTSVGMYVVQDCDDITGSCLAAAPRASEFDFFAATTGRYFLIVDTTFTTSTADFELEVSVQPGFVCQPGAASCDPTTDTLTVCNDDGTAVQETVQCANGCLAVGVCSPPATAPDTCAAPYVVNGSVRFLDNYGRFANDFDPGAGMNTCDITDTDGPDAVYQVALAPNEVLDVTIDDLGSISSPRVYIVSDCNDVENTCLDGAEDFAAARAAYVATTAETVYVVVDTTSATTTDPFIVDIDVRQSECAPSLMQCTSATTGERCTRFGTIESYDCFFGCSAGVCDPPTNDTCTTPFDVTGGGTFEIAIDGYSPDYDPGIGGCTNYFADGAEGVFQISLAEGQVVQVSAASDEFDVGVYMTSTCGDESTCVAGADAFVSATESFTYAAPSTGDYFIYVDTADTAASGMFELVVELPPTICTPTSAVCQDDGLTIALCGPYGLTTTDASCDGFGGCVTGADMCTTLDGELCLSALDATAGGQFTGSFADFEDNHDFVNAFCTGDFASGPEAVYYVDLTMGQTVTATLDAASDTALYITRGCGNIDDLCVAGADVIGGSSEMVSYTATADERVFIYADNYYPSTETFTLDVTIN